MVWKQFILIWAICSSLFTPLEFGFFRGLPEHLFLLDIAGQFAFLIDILAYQDTHSHRTIYNRKLIVIRYLKSRFIVDLLGCLPWDSIYKEEVGRSDYETEVSLLCPQTHCSLGEISVLCNIPQPYTVQVCELSRLLRLHKQSFVNLLEIYFSDARLIIDNLLKGTQTYLRNKIMEPDLALNTGRHEYELALRLNYAAYDGDIYRLRRLVEAGADPDKSDYDGRSPLQIASSKGHEDIVHFLIQKGSRVNLRDNYGNTPLFEAIKNGHDQVASLLVKAGASLNVDNTGNCLGMAVARGDLDFLRRSLAYGINPNSRNYDLRTPLHVAASEGLYLIANNPRCWWQCFLKRQMGQHTPWWNFFPK